MLYANDAVQSEIAYLAPSNYVTKSACSTEYEDLSTPRKAFPKCCICPSLSRLSNTHLPIAPHLLAHPKPGKQDESCCLLNDIARCRSLQVSQPDVQLIKPYADVRSHLIFIVTIESVNKKSKQEGPSMAAQHMLDGSEFLFRPYSAWHIC